MRPSSTSCGTSLIGWIYLYGGLAIWSSRPANRTGRLMTLVGLTWFIGNLQLSDLPVVHDIGVAFADVLFVCLIALILAYPTGRLETRLDRYTVVILAIGTTAEQRGALAPVVADDRPGAGASVRRPVAGDLRLRRRAAAVVRRADPPTARSCCPS